MRTGDRLRNLAKRGIGFPGIFETVFRHDDRVCPPAPFPYKPYSWPDAWTGIRSNAPVRLQFPGQRYESSLSPLAEAALGKLLHAIGDGADKQVTAQPRRVISIQAPPFCAKLWCRQRCQSGDFLRYLLLRRRGGTSACPRRR